MSKDVFGDAIKKALNRDPWAVPGKAEPVEQVKEQPHILQAYNFRMSWDTLCPECRNGWLYFINAKADRAAEIMECHGTRNGFGQGDPDGCGAQFKAEEE